MKLGGIITVEEFNEIESTFCPNWMAMCGFQIIRTQLRPEGYWATIKMKDTEHAEWQVTDYHRHNIVRYACHGKDDMEECELFCVAFNHDNNKFEGIG